jgi:hypothetical protein
MARRLFQGVAAFALVLSTGCGGVSPGDYIVYRVNVGVETLNDACYFPAEMPPEDVAQDSSSFRSSQTWVIYFAAGDETVLDAAGVALRGDKGGDGFEFSADQIDVSYVGIDQQEAKITAQTTIFVAMNTDGDAVDGTITSTTKTSCDFLTAAPSTGLCEQVPDCVGTRPFSGVKLDGVNLKEVVDRPNDEIGGGGTNPPPEPDPNDPPS